MTQELKLGLTEKPSGKQVFGYVIGTVPLVILIGIFSMSYAKFFWDTENGLPFWLYAIGLGIYALVNSINDPFIGQWQDKTNVDKWGSRRLVYVKYGSPILVLLFIFMWFPITMDNTLYLFLHFVIMICAFDTVLNIVTMAWMALLPSMTSNIDERTKINFYGSIIGLFAGFPVIAMPLILVEDRNTFQFLNIIFAAIAFICYILVVKFSKENLEYKFDEIPPIKEAVKQSIQSKSFLMYIGWNFGRGINSSISGAYLYIFLQLLGGDESLVPYFLIMIFIGYTSNIVCLKLRPKYGIKKIVLTYGILKSLGGILIFFIILDPSLEYFMWIGFIWTTWFGGGGIFFTALQTLPIDEDEIKYGSRREGMFYGINALFTKAADSFVGPVLAAAIFLLFQYEEGIDLIDQESSWAIFGVKVVFFLIPNIIALIGLIFIKFYPLIEIEQYNKLEKDLENLHMKKKERLLSEGNTSNFEK